MVRPLGLHSLGRYMLDSSPLDGPWMALTTHIHRMGIVYKTNADCLVTEV